MKKSLAYVMREEDLFKKPTRDNSAESQLSRRVNPRPTQMFFYCNPMATKRSDKNQLNIRLDDESMAILDAQVAYEIEQLKMLLGDKYDMVVGKTATLSRTIVAKDLLIKKLNDLKPPSTETIDI